jgi:hypothetical protein
MSGVPPRGPGKVTLVDAFSALLAAEQGDGSAEASLTAWGNEPGASETESDSYSGANGASSYRGGDMEGVETVEEAASAAPVVTPVTSTAAPAPAVSQEQLEAVVRKVLGEMDGLVREIVTARVLDMTERLVREEIERLKAAAEAEQA